MALAVLAGVLFGSSPASSWPTGGLTPQGGSVVGVDATSGGGLSVTGTPARPSVGLLPSCSTNQILKWTGSAWACSADSGGFDTAGNGLTATGTTVDVVGATGGGLSVLSNSVGLLTSCSSNQVLSWNGSAWGCANGDTLANAGDITGVTAGTDLTGGGTSGTVTLNVDETLAQHRVSGTCTTPNAIISIAQNGTVTCSTGVLNTTNVSGTSGRSARFSGTNTIGNGGWSDTGTDVTAQGNVTSIAGTTTIGAEIDNVTVDTSIAGLTNNYSLGATTRTLVLRPAAGGVQITGITAGASWRRLRVLVEAPANADTGNCVQVFDSNINSTITNRIRLEVSFTGNGYVCPGGWMDCIYDPSIGATTPGRWSCSITWAGDSPTAVTIDGQLSVSGSTVLQATTVTDLTTSGNTTLGDSSSDSITFSNGPSGENLYSGKHLEWTDEFLYGISGTIVTGSNLGNWKVLESGTNAIVSQQLGIAGRPGIVALDTGTATSGGYALLITGESIEFADGNYTVEAAVEWPTLSSTSNSSASMYATEIGYGDTSAVDQQDGCYFAYDAGNGLAGNKNASFAQTLECWCASNSTRTGYLINNAGNSDESFALGVGTVAAGTWYRLKIVMTGTTRAEFYRNGTKVCDINTNLPSTSLRQTSTLLAQFPLAASGTGSRTALFDQLTWKLDLASARNP